MYHGRYLTATQNGGGTSGGTDVNAPGNVYFYGAGLTDLSQDWLLDEGGDEEPSEGGYGNGTITIGQRPSALDYFRDCCSPVFNRFHEDYTTGNGVAQCTWHWYGRAYEVLGKAIEFSGVGALNGAAWYSRITNGKKSSTPAANSIAVWGDGGFGHVAYVEKVDNNCIYISEANWRGTLSAHDDMDGRVYTVPRSNLTRKTSDERELACIGFIHLVI